jgi:hypothetical protein
MTAGPTTEPGAAPSTTLQRLHAVLRIRVEATLAVERVEFIDIHTQSKSLVKRENLVQPVKNGRGDLLH